MKQLLKAISKHTCGMYNYAEVRDGVYYYVSTGKKNTRTLCTLS